MPGYAVPKKQASNNVSENERCLEYEAPNVI